MLSAWMWQEYWVYLYHSSINLAEKNIMDSTFFKEVTQDRAIIYDLHLKCWLIQSSIVTRCETTYYDILQLHTILQELSTTNGAGPDATGGHMPQTRDATTTRWLRQGPTRYYLLRFGQFMLHTATVNTRSCTKLLLEAGDEATS
jgi:hypothetical protein